MSNARKAIVVAVPLVLVVMLIVAAVVATNRAPDTWAADSPEATAQAYFQALIDEDPVAAHETLSSELQDRCDPPTGADISYLHVSRVILDDVETAGEISTVRVSLTQDFGGSPFGPDEMTIDERLHMERTDGVWRISSLPWPYFGCVRKD